MAIDKLIPQYLNADTDQKLVKSVEMTDNLNVRTSTDDEGSGGVLKNVKGTNPVEPKTPVHAFPEGDNRVIGSVVNEKSKEVIFFVWNSNLNHGIYRLQTDIDKYVKVYEDSVLNFQKYSYISCDVILNEDEETLVYFTDNVNPPMKINITRALAGGYPATFTNGTDDEKLSNLTVAKQPPLSPPSYNIVNNSSLGSNNIKNKIFQFAYRYKYIDGEVSALSPYSTAAVSAAQLKDGIVDDSSLEFFNQINVFVQNSSADVEKITLFARNGNTQSFYEVDEIDNSGGTGFSTIFFRNDKITSALSKDEENKIYDNVPQVAKTLSITSNRLMYGNYIEGYQNTDVSVDATPVYRIKPVVSEIPIELNYATPVGSFSDSNPFEIQINYVQLPSTFNINSRISIDLTIVSDHLQVSKTGKYSQMAIVYESLDKETTVKNTGESKNLDFDEPYLSLEAVRVKFDIDIPSGTSKLSAINLVNNAISNKVFNTTVEPKKGDVEHSTIYDSSLTGVKGRVWLEGKAYFKFSPPVQTGSSNLYTSELKFGGAEVYASHLTIVDNNFIGIGTAELTVDIIKSTTIQIAGLSGYNQTGSTDLTTDYQYKNAAITSSSNFIIQDITGHRSFKENAKHDFGIVYLDDRGRASGVNKIESVYISPLSERTNTYANKIDFRINSPAPSFAKKWQLVYGMNSNYDKFLQYTVSRAMPLVKAEAADNHEKLYLSMASLEGKSNSYKEQTDARIEYKYEEGDKLRVVRYKDTNYTYVHHEFNILGYKFVSDANEAPFLANPSDNTEKTGWFLVIQSKDISGFSAKDVLRGNSNWDKETLVEIFTPKKELEEKVYFAIDQTYDVVSGQHYGQRDVTSGGSYSIDILSTSTASSNERFYINDSFDVDGTTATITNVFINLDGTYSYEYTSVNTVSVGTYSVSIINYQDAVISTGQGDVYFRARKLRTGNPLRKFYPMLSGKYVRNSFQYDLDFVEDKSVSDFFRSDYMSIGKPYGYIPEAKRLRRKSSITYSDAFVIDSDRLNLSSFNLSLANWSDLDIAYGGIDRLIARGDALTVLQESKASQLPIGRNLIEYASGDAGVTVSRNVLGVPSYYAGDFGTSGNPESVVERFGAVYYTDLNSRKVIRLSADGITPISEKGMSSLFNEVFEDLSNNAPVPKIVGGFDPDNDEYIVTVEDLSQSYIYVDSFDPELEPFPYEVELNEDGLYTPTQVYTSSAVIWNNINFNWQSICSNWNDLGNGILNIESGQVLLDSSWYDGEDTIYILITNSSNSFVAVGQINLLTGEIILPSETCSGQSITTDFGGSEAQGLTIAYKHKAGVWSSKYSFKPTNYANIGNKLYSFYQSDSGLAWVHNKNETRNNFYGTQYDSMFEMSSNYNPSMIKTYEALGIEGNGSWTSVIETSSQKTSIKGFDEREGHQYAMIRRDIENSNGHKIYMGTVESVSGSNVVFTTPINRIPFNIGDELKTVVGSTISFTGSTVVSIIDRKSLVCSSAVFSVGDNIMIEQSSYVNGDPIRDVFAKFKMVSSDTEPYEVHALSVNYTRSRLHNDRVN
jgi:hypothetical protein